MQKGLYYCETVTVMAGQTTIIQAKQLVPALLKLLTGNVTFHLTFFVEPLFQI